MSKQDCMQHTKIENSLRNEEKTKQKNNKQLIIYRDWFCIDIITRKISFYDTSSKMIYSVTAMHL